MPNQASATARALEFDFVSRLARFFPDATPVRIPVRVSRNQEESGIDLRANEEKLLDNLRKGAGADNPWQPLQETVIEFGTPQEVLFVVAQPLEFADQLLLESRDGSFCAEASVVAVQYHPERTVVAARFLKPVPNWIVKS